MSFPSFILPQNISIAWLMRGKRLPHFAAFSKSVAAEARAANVSRVSMDDTVKVFMVGLSGALQLSFGIGETCKRVCLW